MQFNLFPWEKALSLKYLEDRFKSHNMSYLSQYDLKQILLFLQQLHTITKLSEFPSRLLSILPLVIESDFTLIAGTDPILMNNFENNLDSQVNNKTLAATLVTDDFQLLSQAEISIPYFLQNPVTMNYLSTGDSSARQISDFLSESEMYQREALYGKFLEPLGMLDQMSLVVTEPKQFNQKYIGLDSNLINNLSIKLTPSSVYLEEELADLVIIIHRNQRNFTERDREKLNLLNPHILQAYRNSQIISRMQEQGNHLTQVLSQTNSIIINRDGSVKLMTEESNKLISKYFPSSSYQKDSLPTIINNWLQKTINDLSIDGNLSKPILPLRITQNNHILIVRLSIDPTYDQYLLILKEQKPLNSSFSKLEEMGLTKREAEIIHWMIRDKSNQQISEILNISHRTVQKHCENIYSKLGVNNRAASITKVLQKLCIAILS